MFQNLVCNNHPCCIFPRIIKMLYFIFQVRQVLTLIQYKEISHEEIRKHWNVGFHHNRGRLQTALTIFWSPTYKVDIGDEIPLLTFPGPKDWSETNVTSLNDCYTTISGHFFALWMFILNKTEVQKVSLRYLTDLNPNLFKIYDPKPKYFHIHFFAIL